MPPTPQSSSAHVDFDNQADVFDARTGLPDHVAKTVAAAVLDLACLKTGAVLVDVGAGTGTVGAWLCRGPHAYVGLDASAPMLERYRARLAAAGVAAGVVTEANAAPMPPAAEPGATVRLQVADADARWPLADNTVAAVFGARVFHLLNAQHIVAECRRLAAPGGLTLIEGRLKRGSDDPRDAMRHRLHQLLRAHGVEPRRTGERRSALWQAATAAGAELLPSIAAAAWSERVRPRDALDGWRAKDSLGGVTPPADVRTRVLTELTAWTKAEYLNLESEIESTTIYELTAARFPRPAAKESDAP